MPELGMGGQKGKRVRAALRKISFRLLYTGLTPKTRAADLWTSILNGSWNCLIFHVRQHVHGAERISEGPYSPSGDNITWICLVEIQKFYREGGAAASLGCVWLIHGENRKMSCRTHGEHRPFLRGKWCGLIAVLYFTVVYNFILITVISCHFFSFIVELSLSLLYTTVVKSFSRLIERSTYSITAWKFRVSSIVIVFLVWCVQ